MSGLETQVASLSLHNEPLASLVRPPLLRIPPELRTLIYKHLLTVGQYFWYDPKESYLDTAILEVNHQIHDEALDCLIKSNLWCGLTTDFPLPSWSLQLGLPFYTAPKIHKELLAQEVTIRFVLDGRYSPCFKSVIFAYQPLQYMMLIQDLSSAAERSWALEVLASPVKLRLPSAFTKLIEPLYTVRDFAEVRLQGLQEYPTHRGPLLDEMMRASDTFESVAAIMQWCLKQTLEAESRGRYSDALVYCDPGCWSPYRMRPRFWRGTPEDNSLRHMEVDLYIAYTRNGHKHVVQLKKTAPLSVVTRHTTQEVLLAHIKSGLLGMTFPGLTDEQLCRAHLYIAFAFFHYADCLSPYLDTFGVAWLKRDIPCRVRDCIDLYLHASHYLFFARQLDCWDNIFAELGHDDLAVYNAIQKRPGPQGWAVAVCKVPLLDNWKGDPCLWSSWSKSEQLLLKQYRLRHNQSPDDEAGSHADLSAEYADIGIGLAYTHLGQLYPIAIGDVDQGSLFQAYGLESITNGNFS